MSKRLKSVGAVALLIVLGVVVESVPSSAGAQSQAAGDHVIVVLRNQESALPATRRDIAARRSAVQQTQAPVVRDLASSGATNVHALTLINAVTATVSDTEEAQLKANPAVREVVPDQIIRLAPPDLVANRTGSGNAATSSGSATNVCPAPGKVQLNPQALELIHADSDDPSASTARKLGIDGSGVVVGLIADGLDPNNPDLIRPNGQHVVTDYKDFSGDGTGAPTGGEEAFGDAASIAAQGNKVYNVAGFGPHAVKTPCDIRIEGVAPGASVVALSVFGEDDEAGFNSSVLQAINYAVTADHVNVLNESLGSNYYPDLGASLDLIKAANDAAIGAGTTVVTSSGDAGVTNTIATPATDPGVIATGATTSYRIDLQDGYGGAQFPGITGYLNNNTSSFSSAGFEQTGHTIDVVAPGEDNWSLCSKDVAIYQDCTNYNGQPTNFLPFGGTSESAPLTSGTAALVYQAYDKTHGTYPTPQVTKQIITSTADDIGSPADQEGAGLIDAVQAVRAAESYQAPASAPPPAGNTVLHSPS